MIFKSYITKSDIHILQGVFFDSPLPKLLEYGTRPPSTQKFSKVPDWPPLNTKIILSSEQILYQNSQGLSQILVLRGGQSGT